jgi:hypothetical protein
LFLSDTNQCHLTNLTCGSFLYCRTVPLRYAGYSVYLNLLQAVPALHSSFIGVRAPSG